MLINNNKNTHRLDISSDNKEAAASTNMLSNRILAPSAHKSDLPYHATFYINSITNYKEKKGKYQLNMSQRRLKVTGWQTRNFCKNTFARKKKTNWNQNGGWVLFDSLRTKLIVFFTAFFCTRKIHFWWRFLSIFHCSFLQYCYSLFLINILVYNLCGDLGFHECMKHWRYCVSLCVLAKVHKT